jgi:1-carboxybiuret hydrolase
LTRYETFPFCDSLDHVGPSARSVYNLALAYDAMQGPDTRDHACAERELQLVGAELTKGVDKLHIAMTDGFSPVTGLGTRNRVALRTIINRHNEL